MIFMYLATASLLSSGIVSFLILRFTDERAENLIRKHVGKMDFDARAGKEMEIFSRKAELAQIFMEKWDGKMVANAGFPDFHF